MDVRVQVSNVRFDDGISFGTQLLESRLHIEGVPQHDHVDHQAERSQLILLAFAIALPELTVLAMEHDAT